MSHRPRLSRRHFLESFAAGIAVAPLSSAVAIPLPASSRSTDVIAGAIRWVGLTRFGGHLSVYREGVRNVEQGNEVSSGISQANGRIGLGRPQIRGPIQRVRPT